MGLPYSMVDIDSDKLMEGGTPIFLSLQVSIVNSFLVSGRALCLLAFWDLAGLTVQGLFVLPQSL